VAGNAEQVHSQLIQIGNDATPPATSIACNGAACGTGWFKKSPITVTLSATDTGGSGVDKTYYTTNGSTPTTSSTVYTAPFTVSQTTNVKFFSRDKAGNAEAVRSQLVGFDSTPPVTTITCNGSSCSTGWYTSTPVSVALSATDGSGSGVDKTYYTTDGPAPTTSRPVYTAPVEVTQT